MFSKKLKQYKNYLFDYWQEMSHSMYRRMSRGAFYINRMIPYARNEEWRRPGASQRERKKKHQ